MRRFEIAVDASAQNVYSAREALESAADATTDAERRNALTDVLESLMNASYDLGLAEGHLFHAGRRDPLSVPRYRQVAELFSSTWQGAQDRRVANIGDRGRAALASGFTAAAGAVMGAVTLGLPGAIVGSVVGGGIGPWAFMRDMRHPRDLSDSALGGGVGGLFTPVGAALGAYLAGDELARAGNPSRMANGWIGDPEAVENYLSVVGADRDRQGRFLVGGDPPIYGGGEVVISGGSVYYAEGRPVPLSPALAETSRGLPVRVFNRRPNMDPTAVVERINDAIADEDWRGAEDSWDGLVRWVAMGGSWPPITIDLAEDDAYEWMAEGELTEDEWATIQAFNREVSAQRKEHLIRP